MAFLRRISNRYSKLGKRRKKKQFWRKPKGRDNKMREKRRGYPVVVSIGYRKESKKRREKILVENIKQLESFGKDKIIVLGRMGKKKKLEIAKKAHDMKIPIQNLNVKKFLKKHMKKEKSEKVTQEKKNEPK